MSDASAKTWARGEYYELLCLAGIAECLWIIGAQLDLFPILAAFTFEHGLFSFVILGFLMSFFVGVGSVRKSVRLRREMSGRASAEAHAQNLARHDPLTGMANRRLLSEAIQEAVSHGAETYAIFLIDLDRFKPVNDIYGHEAGDAVLCEAADRIKEHLPEGATAARLGGDEFALLLRYSSRTELMRLAERIIKGLSQPLECQAALVEVGATIGIALFPEDGVEAEALLRCADIAMYRGKREGRGTYRFFEQSMDEELRARTSLEMGLLSAITKGEIKPHYQPLVALPGRTLLGFEVLARWYHPEKGVLAPDLFIPIAEDTGLIAELSYTLLRQACLDARAWPEHLQLAVNISPHQLKDKLLAERLLGILSTTGFDPHRLEVEITESALTNDLETARDVLHALQREGVSIALDDFGTGYSSLCHLRDMNFDKIKIDRSFVQSIGDNPESAKIVNAILGLGRSLGVITTAEGIENAANSDWLAEHGCTHGQGFLFGQPMSAGDVDRQLEDGFVDDAMPERAQAIIRGAIG